MANSLTIKPTSTKPYSKGLERHPMSQIATEADVSASTTPLVIPTTDPLIAGAIWNNAGVLTISVG